MDAGFVVDEVCGWNTVVGDHSVCKLLELEAGWLLAAVELHGQGFAKPRDMLHHVSADMLHEGVVRSSLG